ncbi:MAG: PAS domain S-box protein, partial [Gammaproteobacteria bacterium]|nr:PAS domain S-box protein [Gammaproteobacteria bacterium]
MFFRDERFLISQSDDKRADIEATASLGLTALQALEAGVVVVDLREADQPIVFANEGFVRVTGYTPEEILGRNCRFLQGPDTDKAVVDEMRAAIVAGRKTTVVVKNYRKDGSSFWNEVQLVPFRQHGEITHYTGIQTDVTTRIEGEQRLRESESQLRLLLDSAAEAIYGIDNEGKCTFCNPACVRMLGYESADELIGRNMHALIHSKDIHGNLHPRQRCKIYRAFIDGLETHSDTEVFWRKDGSSFPVEYRSHPIKRGDQTVGAVVNFFDIT